MLFSSNRTGVFGLYSARDDGSGTAESLLVKTGRRAVHEGVLTPDAHTLLYRQGVEPSSDLFYLPRAAAESRPILTSGLNERAPALSRGLAATWRSEGTAHEL